MRNLLYLIVILCSLSCDNRSQRDFEVKEGLMRSELVRMSLPEQREIFSTLSPEMKSKLYCYKFTMDLKEQHLSINERRFLKELRNFASPQTYEAPVPPLQEADLLSRMDLMGWDEHDMFKYTMTFMTVNEYDDYMNKRLIE